MKKVINKQEFENTPALKEVLDFVKERELFLDEEQKDFYFYKGWNASFDGKDCFYVLLPKERFLKEENALKKELEKALLKIKKLQKKEEDDFEFIMEFQEVFDMLYDLYEKSDTCDEVIKILNIEGQEHVICLYKCATNDFVPYTDKVTDFIEKNNIKFLEFEENINLIDSAKITENNIFLELEESEHDNSIIYLNVKTGKAFKHFKAHYNEEKDEYISLPNEYIDVEECINYKKKSFQNIIRKVIELKRRVTLFEVFEIVVPDIYNLVKNEEEFDIEEFVSIEKDKIITVEGYDDIRDVSYKLYEGYDITFSTKNKFCFLITKREYDDKKIEFEHNFKKEVDRTNNFDNCESQDIYEAFERHPLYIDKIIQIDNVEYCLMISSMDHSVDETEELMNDYIKKHNIKVSDPENVNL